MDIFPKMRDFTEDEEKKFNEACWDYDDNNLCHDCSHAEEPQESRACSSCIQWVDGYLEATNYKNSRFQFFKNYGEGR